MQIIDAESHPTDSRITGGVALASTQVPCTPQNMIHKVLQSMQE
jgi:hypothetical protein